jgi:hypothetical protein
MARSDVRGWQVELELSGAEDSGQRFSDRN